MKCPFCKTSQQCSHLLARVQLGGSSISFGGIFKSKLEDCFSTIIRASIKSSKAYLDWIIELASLSGSTKAIMKSSNGEDSILSVFSTSERQTQIFEKGLDRATTSPIHYSTCTDKSVFKDTLHLQIDATKIQAIRAGEKVQCVADGFLESARLECMAIWTFNESPCTVKIEIQSIRKNNVAAVGDEYKISFQGPWSVVKREFPSIALMKIELTQNFQSR